MLPRSIKYRMLILILTALVLYSIIAKLMNKDGFEVPLVLLRQFPNSFTMSKSPTEKCVFPKVTTTIDDLKPLFHDSRPLECNPKQPDWVICKKSICSVRSVILRRRPDANCMFIEVMFNSDFGVYDGPTKSGAVTYTLQKSDVVKVYCKSRRSVWSSVLMGFRNETRTPKENISAAARGSLMNVLILGFASVSRNTFIQKMPHTFKFLIRNLKGSVLKGYNVVGGESLSSLYPFLTGLRRDQLKNTESTYIDSYPFIWKLFRDSGYATAYLEDFALWGFPGATLDGFKNMPTDHYLRHYYFAGKWKTSMWPPYCSGSIPRHRIIMEYIKNFYSAYRQSKTFLFSFQGELTYRNFNNLGMIDADLLDLFRSLYALNVLDNTLVIIMSDRGYKFSLLRKSLEAIREEMQPFLYVRLPANFAITHPISYANFMSNLKTLTTPFDLYFTMKNILGADLNDSASYSLFDKIPTERSCSEAHIQRNWCGCMVKNKTVDISYDLGQIKHVIEFTLNNMISGVKDKCAELSVTSITNYTQIIPNADLRAYKTDKEYFIVTVLVLPGYTTHKVTLVRNVSSGIFIMSTDGIISYDIGLHSQCINQDSKLRPFCFCKNQV